jgi:hypothetical protein
VKNGTCTKCQAAAARATESLGIANEAQARAFDLEQALREVEKRISAQPFAGQVLLGIDVIRAALNGPP